jgi:GntR family transcriptional regulator, histidine utilization repressor
MAGARIMDENRSQMHSGANDEPSGLGDEPQPLYQKVKTHIRQLIDSGQLPPQSRIPSEYELVAALSVSRMTVHRALRELTADGLLVRVQGVGTFVAPPKPRSALLEIVSIADEIRRRGGIHSSSVHVLRAEPASSEIAGILQLAPRSQVFHAVLVHHDRGRPIQLADRFVNPVVAPRFLEQDFTRLTPNAYLLAVAPITEVDHVIEAVLADEKARTLLNLKKNTPCLVLHRTTWSGDRVATHSRFTYPGPLFRLGGRFKPGSGLQGMVA